MPNRPTTAGTLPAARIPRHVAIIMDGNGSRDIDSAGRRCI
jgi:undecaprenyl pyrophosphate synthase